MQMLVLLQAANIAIATENDKLITGFWHPVDGWAHASRVVRDYITDYDLGAGCATDAPAFIGGTVTAGGKTLGRISYNGRAWDVDDKEIAL